MDFLANNTKFEPNMLTLKKGVIDLDLQGHLAISTHFEFEETTFNVALVYWFRPAPVWLCRIQIQFSIKNKVSKYI